MKFFGIDERKNTICGLFRYGLYTTNVMYFLFVSIAVKRSDINWYNNNTDDFLYSQSYKDFEVGGRR